MYSESQNVAIHTHFEPNNSTKLDDIKNDIDSYIDDVLINDPDPSSIEFNLLKHHSQSGHADTIFHSIIQRLPEYFQETIFSQFDESIVAYTLTQIFELQLEKLEFLSNLFEGSKYYSDNKGRNVLIHTASKILKKNILNNQTIFNIMANEISDLYIKFRHHQNGDDNSIFYKFLHIITQIKMEKEFANAIVPAISSDFSGTIPINSGSLFLTSLTKSLDAELEALSECPQEFVKIIMLPIRIYLYGKLLDSNLETFTDECLSAKNSQALSLLSSLIIELKDSKLNDKFIEFLSIWAINKTTAIINRNVVACIPELMDLFFLFQNFVKVYNIDQANYCLKYFKGCLINSSSKVSYLASRYIHQQVQQNNNSFIKQIPDLLNFLLELDSVPYLFSCFRQFLGLRTLNYFPEKFMSDSELFNQIGIIFSIDQKNLLSRMYPDLKESSTICSEFTSTQKTFIPFRIMLMSVENWPSYPQFPLQVDNEILAIRRKFEAFYTGLFANKKIKWIDSLETCVFTYQGYNIIAFTVQYVTLKFLKDGIDLNESGIPKEYHPEIFSSLVRAGILSRKNGKIAFLKLKQPQKTIRINTLTINYPEKIPEKDEDTIFFAQRKKISANIMIALKKKNELNYSKLYRKTQDLLDFPLPEKSFKNCLSGLLAQQMIIKGNDKIYRYFPI